MPRNARIVVEHGEALVFTPYLPELVERIRALPTRRWDRERRCWIVPEALVDDVVEILKDYFDGMVTGPPKYGQHQAVEPPTHWVDGLFADCPPAARIKIYRALAYAFHPDTGGDGEIMRRINAAYAQRTQQAS